MKTSVPFPRSTTDLLTDPNGWINGWMVGWVDGWMDGGREGGMYVCMYVCMYVSMYVLSSRTRRCNGIPAIHIKHDLFKNTFFLSTIIE